MEDEEDLETLGEQLYSLIYPKHKEDAGKLTGMLLELPGPVLSQMLQDESLLMTAVEKALRALQLPQEPCKVTCKDEDDVSVSSDSLGEQLFELVDVYNTGHSQKITGMLLEQHKDAVLSLLSDPKVLEEQVTLALKTLKDPASWCLPLGPTPRPCDRRWTRLMSVTHLRLMILTSWERSSSHWWRKLIHSVQMISQVCCWRWSPLPSNSCSLTTQCWKTLFRKHKQHWILRTELSVLQKHLTHNNTFMIMDELRCYKTGKK